MFTGIIEAKTTVLKKTSSQLVLHRPVFFDDIAIGTSIGICGTCLSVIEFDQQQMTFDVVDETWNKTKLGKLKEGDLVNLERAMKADGRFEGHIVQGHIEGVASVVEEGESLAIQLPEELTHLVVDKGSITIDGVSLTVAKIDGAICSVALIPHTLETTTLGDLIIGDFVNIETDILGRYVYAMHQK